MGRGLRAHVFALSVQVQQLKPQQSEHAGVSTDEQAQVRQEENE